MTAGLHHDQDLPGQHQPRLLPQGLGLFAQRFQRRPIHNGHQLRIPVEAWLLATLCDVVEMGHPPSA